ncbi:MAG: LamG domain-containing protein [Lentisphaeria bacterium]|nr:LamG domain-containing protein [Lentisphaeria bacterium]
MKKTLFLLGGLCAAMMLTAQDDPDLLFEANFDNFSVNADIAAGDAKCKSFADPSLEARKAPGVNGKGNAVILTAPEGCDYAVDGNFDATQGTVTVYVAAQNWKPSAKTVQIFFDAALSDEFRLLLYKNPYANCFYALLSAPDADGKRQNFQATSFLTDDLWPAGKWHRLDVTWDSRYLKLYVDGVQTPRKSWHVSTRKFPQVMTFSNQSSASGYLSIGTSPGWRSSSSVKHGDATAFDLVRVWKRPLTAEEIKNDHDKYIAR